MGDTERTKVREITRRQRRAIERDEAELAKLLMQQGDPELERMLRRAIDREQG